MNKFPCRECLLKTCCTAYCDKLISDEKTIALYLETYKLCPDCGGSHLEGIQPVRQAILCKSCHKAFEKVVRVEFKETVIGSSSSSPSGGNSTSVSSSSVNLIIIPGPQHKHDAVIITDITKYGMIKPPWNGEKKPKIEPVREAPPRREYTTYRRMTPSYSRVMERQFAEHISESLSTEKKKIDLLDLAPEWIYKHRDLFIQDPDENMAEGPSVEIVT